MKKKSIFICLVLIFILNFSTYSYGLNNLDPIKNKNAKFKIAYCENDPYFNYTGTLYGIIKGLYELGWIKNIENIPYDSGSDDSKILWNWLSNNDVSDYIEFVDDAFISLIDMNEDTRFITMKNKLKNNDIDLILTMGTKAGKYTSENIRNIPVMVFSSSNAVRSNIVSGTIYSQSNNIWAHVDPNRYERQLRVFYDLFKFKRLGIVYENTELGKTLSAINTVKSFCLSHDITLVEKYVSEAKSIEDIPRYEEELKLAYESLSKEVDAFYLTVGSRELSNTHSYLTPFYLNKIPVFSQVGPTEVQRGALMSVYRYNYDGIGRFGADRLIRILKGSGTNDITQIYGDTPSISFNLEVANKIGYKIPFQILLISDIVYKKIK